MYIAAKNVDWTRLWRRVERGRDKKIKKCFFLLTRKRPVTNMYHIHVVITQQSSNIKWNKRPNIKKWSFRNFLTRICTFRLHCRYGYAFVFLCEFCPSLSEMCLVDFATEINKTVNKSFSNLSLSSYKHMPNGGTVHDLHLIVQNDFILLLNHVFNFYALSLIIPSLRSFVPFT